MHWHEAIPHTILPSWCLQKRVVIQTIVENYIYDKTFEPRLVQNSHSAAIMHPLFLLNFTLANDMDTPVIWQNKPSEHQIYIFLLLTLIIQQSKTTNKTSPNKLKLSKHVLSAILSHFVDALPIGDEQPRHGYFYTGDARHRAIELRYSKRYFGHYGPHWGYRFIQSSWLGDKFLWTSAWGMIVLTKEVQD